MKKETKDLLVSMVKSWNTFNPQKAVDAHFDESEFSPKHWSIDMAIEGVVCSDFMAFFLPALQAQDCVWFFSGYSHQVIFHIQ